MKHSDDSTSFKSRVAITGATGLIGKRITEILIGKKMRVVAFVRNKKAARKVLGDRVRLARWNFERPGYDEWKEYLGEVGGIIHLAGTPIFKKRWTKSFKKKILTSRVESTRQLVDAIKASEHRPRAFVSASAVGIYGQQHESAVDENVMLGNDPLAGVCVHWENEAKRIEQQNVRSVQIRTGVVLSPDSGALKEMLPLFKLGLGGPLGFPENFMNWIHIEDIAQIFVGALFDSTMRGAYNAVAPNPVTMEMFSETLAQILKKSYFTRHPVWLLRMAIGEASKHTSSHQKVLANKILKTGYVFKFTNLNEALKDLLK